MQCLAVTHLSAAPVGAAVSTSVATMPALIGAMALPVTPIIAVRALGMPSLWVVQVLQGFERGKWAYKKA
jgi:hypothetical protein